MKKVAKALFILSVLFVLALLQPYPSFAEAQSFSLTWAFIVAGTAGPDRVLDVAKQPVLHSGDRMRIVIERKSPCSIYLFLLDSHDELTLLYPAPPAFSETPNGAKIELPGKEEWYTIDNSEGMETFQLLVSSRPLEPLEKAARSYTRQPESMEMKAVVLEEIKKARRSHSGLASAVEKGISIAGTMQTRSAQSSPQGEATQVEAREFYAKTIRLPHE
jgi:hypothetical protein